MMSLSNLLDAVLKALSAYEAVRQVNNPNMAADNSELRDRAAKLWAACEAAGIDRSIAIDAIRGKVEEMRNKGTPDAHSASQGGGPVDVTSKIKAIRTSQSQSLKYPESLSKPKPK